MSRGRHVPTSRQLVWRLRACSLVGLLLLALPILPILGPTPVFGEGRPLWLWDIRDLVWSLADDSDPQPSPRIEASDDQIFCLLFLLMHLAVLSTWSIALHVFSAAAWLPTRLIGPRLLGVAVGGTGLALLVWLAWLLPDIDFALLIDIDRPDPHKTAEIHPAREVAAFGELLVPVALGVLASLVLVGRTGRVILGSCACLVALALAAFVLRVVPATAPASPVGRSWVGVVVTAALALLAISGGLLAIGPQRARRRAALAVRWLARLAVVGWFLLGALWFLVQLPHDEIGLYTIPVRAMVLAATSAVALSTGLHLLIGAFDDGPDPRALPKAFT